MMLSELKSIRAHFTILVVTGLLLAPLTGIGSARLFGLISATELASPRTLGLIAPFVSLTVLWTFAYFYHYFSPLSDWSGHRPGACLTPRQQRRLAGFSRDYWTFFLLYAVATPVLVFIASGQPT